MRSLLLSGFIAVTVLVPAPLVQAQSIDELFRQGNAAQATGDYAGAEAIWRLVLQRDPDNAVAYNNLGNALVDQGRYAEAEAAFQEAIRIDSDFALPYYNLGRVLNNRERYAEAEVAYREAIRIDSDFVLAYNNLGNTLLNQGRYEAAEAAHREAIRLDPDNALAYNNLGNTLLNQGRYEAAEAAYREAIRLDPDYAVAYNNLGYLYQVQERYEAAIGLYGQALVIAPDYTRAENNLAEVQRLLNLQTNPVPTRADDLAWLPANEPLLPVLRAVVRVVTTTSTGIEYGTGVVVQREGSRIWVLTNRHVVTDGLLGSVADDEQRAQRQAAPLSDEVSVDFFSEPPAGRTWLRLEAEIVDATGPQDDLDLALLLIENAPDDIQPLALASESAGLDTDVRLIGHHNAPWGLSRGYISQRPQGTVLQLAGAAIGRRSSGSPILDAENRVVGIVTSIEPPGIGQGNDFLGGFSYGHPSSAVLDMLNRWGMN